MAIANPTDVPATVGGTKLPSLVERAGVAARFAWDEFFYAEHHNPHTQKASMRVAKRFLAWAEGQGVELPAITPGMMGQYLVGLERFTIGLRKFGWLGFADFDLGRATPFFPSLCVMRRKTALRASEAGGRKPKEEPPGTWTR